MRRISEAHVLLMRHRPFRSGRSSQGRALGHSYVSSSRNLDVPSEGTCWALNRMLDTPARMVLSHELPSAQALYSLLQTPPSTAALRHQLAAISDALSDALSDVYARITAVFLVVISSYLV